MPFPDSWAFFATVLSLSLWRRRLTSDMLLIPMVFHDLFALRDLLITIKGLYTYQVLVLKSA